MSATTSSAVETRPALDPQPVADAIDALLGDVTSGALSQVEASEKVNAILDTYADAIEAAGGGEDGDPDMWDWSERVRWASTPDGYEGWPNEDYVNEFADALVPLRQDPRPNEDD